MIARFKSTVSIMALLLVSVMATACLRPVRPSSTPIDKSYPDWNFLLARYVNDQGVDYAAIATNREVLDRVLSRLQSVTSGDFKTWPEHERLAFLINAHNVFAVKRIVDAWPVTSLEDTRIAGSARDARDIQLIGRNWSLNSLADKILGPEFLESRALFLINWGERGCAPLPTVPVTALNLSDLLERQPRRVLAGRDFCIYDEPNQLIRVTPLIELHREQLERDFTTLWVFLERYLPPDQAKRVKNRPPRIRYLDFDKRLNAATSTAVQQAE